MAKIHAFGTALPAEKVRTSTLEDRLGLATDSLGTGVGVLTRYVCSAEESQITLGVAAGQAALDRAGLRAGDIDLVIGASAVPYQPIPATAPAYMAGLGMVDGSAFAFDVNATCLSFLNALDVATALIDAGRYRRALIIASEVASRALPWEAKPEVAALFGDGAAAAVVGPGAQTCVTRFATYPSGYEICGIGAGGTRFDLRSEAEAFHAHSLFDMDGKALFRLTTQHFGGFVDALLADAGWTAAEVDLVVPHQASPLALRHMIRHCGFAPEKVVDIVADYGNQIAASIPFAAATVQDRMVPGTKLLMLGTSAGVSFGGAAVLL